MIKLLVRFAAWLDTRFPAKVTVTLEDYGRLADKMAHFKQRFEDHSNILAHQSLRISGLEESVKALKEAVGKTIAPAAVSAEKRRADFVATGRMAD